MDKELIKELARKSLEKWSDPQNPIMAFCGFCDEFYEGFCEKCLCPEILCSGCADYGLIYDSRLISDETIEAADPFLVDLMKMALSDLQYTGEISETVRNKIEEELDSAGYSFNF
jgi:hypothetical protein